MKSAVIVPLSRSRLIASAAVAPAREQRVAIQATSRGLEPSTVVLEAGTPGTLVVTLTTDHTCAKNLVIQGWTQKLPLDRAMEIRLAPEKPRKVGIACGMGTISGAFVAE